MFHVEFVTRNLFRMCTVYLGLVFMIRVKMAPLGAGNIFDTLNMKVLLPVMCFLPFIMDIH